MFEERILDSRVEFLLRELLRIAKEFHDLLVDLVKRKRQSMEENTPRVNANTVLMYDTEVEDESRTPTTQGHTGHVQLRKLRSESATSNSPC